MKQHDTIKKKNYHHFIKDCAARTIHWNYVVFMTFCLAFISFFLYMDECSPTHNDLKKRRTTFPKITTIFIEFIAGCCFSVESWLQWVNNVITISFSVDVFCHSKFVTKKNMVGACVVFVQYQIYGPRRMSKQVVCSDTRSVTYVYVRERGGISWCNCSNVSDLPVFPLSYFVLSFGRLYIEPESYESTR